MPEDQETVTPRRRSRRQDAAVPQDNEVAAVAAPATTAPRRRTTKSTPSAQADAPASVPEPAGDGTATATSTPRRRTSRAAQQAAEPQATHDAQATTAAEQPARARRASRVKVSADASAPLAAQPIAAQPETPATENGTHPAARTRRAPRTRAAEQAPVATPAAPAPAEAESPVVAPAEPVVRRTYRFDRPAAAEQQVMQAPAAETRAEEPVQRPLRRVDRLPQEQYESQGEMRAEPRDQRRSRPGDAYDPHRRQQDMSGTRGAPAPNTPQRNGTRGPYMPGMRPQTPASQPYEQPHYGGQQGGYAPYAPFDPYTSYPNAPQDQRGGQPRSPRGSRYGQSSYSDQRDQRDRRGGRGDMYHEQQSGRSTRGRGTHGVIDRRAPGGRRAPTGGRPTRSGQREAPYGGSLYSNVPSAPTESRYTHEPRYTPESRYQGPGSMRGGAAVAPGRMVEVRGLLWLGGGPGMSAAELLDERTLQPAARVSPEDVRRFGLRSGDVLVARAEERGGRRMVVEIDQVNDVALDELGERPLFEQLTASFPNRRIRLEQGQYPISARIIDLFAPLGFGSRALIVAPPKTGKTTLIREAAESVLKGYPDAVVMAVLVGERPEEVTDLRARLEPRGGLVFAASFDEDTQRHAWLVQVAVERAKRVAESGRDAFMVLDSLTRLARAENLASRGQGRTLSGGIDAQALDTGRRAFGAARNLEEGGSLTILATCLVETGSRQDDVVYEEFKGTGNMELHLSRELAQRRLFPAVDAVKSGTRREEMLLTPEELRAATALRRRLADLPTAQATQQLLSVIERTPSNAALLQAIEQSGWISSTR